MLRGLVLNAVSEGAKKAMFIGGGFVAGVATYAVGKKVVEKVVEKKAEKANSEEAEA